MYAHPLQKEWTMECSHCHKVASEFLDCQLKQSDANKAFTDRGWIVKRRASFCPDCVKADTLTVEDEE